MKTETILIILLTGCTVLLCNRMYEKYTAQEYLVVTRYRVYEAPEVTNNATTTVLIGDCSRAYYPKNVYVCVEKKRIELIK